MGLLDWSDELWKKKQKEERKHQRNKEAKAICLLKLKKTRRGKKVKNKRKIPSMTYRQYMRSAYWKKRKLNYWSKFRKSCAICGVKKGVTLHHKRYDVKYGDEPDNCLVALCPFHHHGFHTSYELKQNMVNDTNRYVKEGEITHRQLQESNIDDLSWIE